MRVAFASGSVRKVGDVPVTSLVWRTPASRTIGELECYVPRDSTLYDAQLLRDEGGWLVDVEHPTLGHWRGITLPPQIADGRAGATVRAQEIAVLTTLRLVARNRTFRALTAGAIAYAAVKGAGGVLTPGTFLEAAPVMASYSFTGQTLASVLGDLMAATGQEWTITPNGVVSWVAGDETPAASLLCQGSALVEVGRDASVSSRATAAVASSPSGRSFTAEAPESAGDLWQLQIPVSVSSENLIALGRAAVSALQAQRSPAVTYRAKLSRAYWSQLREGQRVRLVLPGVAFSGEAPLVRVVERAYQEGNDYVTLTLARVREWSAQLPISYGAETDRSIFVDYQYDANRRLAAIERSLAQQRG